MIGIYHSRDLDGWTCGAIMKRKYPEIKLLGYDYGEKFPWDKIKEGEAVIMADVSLPMYKMHELAKISGDLLWIDHHKSAIDEFWNYNNHNSDKAFCHHALRTDLSACEIAYWEFFNKIIPLSIEFLGMYDSFRHKGTDKEQDVLMFQYRARSLANDPESADYFLDMSLEETLDLVQEGGAIYEYLCMDAQQNYEKNTFELGFDGYKFLAVNVARLNPVNFGIDYHKDGYDGFACFWYGNGKWSFSLYNDNGKVDCSEICKRRGGGGHKGAAGFVVENIYSVISFPDE